MNHIKTFIQLNESNSQYDGDYVVFKDIKSGDRISYLIPGTKNELSSGTVVSKGSTRTEKFITVIDDISKETISSFENYWYRKLKQ